MPEEVEECTDWQDTGGSGEHLGASFSLCRILRRGELGVTLEVGRLLGEDLQGDRHRLSAEGGVGVNRRLGVGFLGLGEAGVLLTPTNEDSGRPEGLETLEDEDKEREWYPESDDSSLPKMLSSGVSCSFLSVI